MECKLDIVIIADDYSVELIDTLWNVNISIISMITPFTSELIDTLWNVNFSDKRKNHIDVYRINRYIMECKYHASFVCRKGLCRINRYIMECKCRILF